MIAFSTRSAESTVATDAMSDAVAAYNETFQYPLCRVDRCNDGLDVSNDPFSTRSAESTVAT